jgi:hypothetical protein
MAMQPNDNVNNVPMDMVKGFRIEAKFTMILLGALWAKIPEHYRMKPKIKPVEITISAG